MNNNGRSAAAVALVAACLLAAGAASAGERFFGWSWNSGGDRVWQAQNYQVWQHPHKDENKYQQKSRCKTNCSKDKPSVVPIPAAAWLFGSGLLGMVGIGYRRRSKTA